MRKPPNYHPPALKIALLVAASLVNSCASNTPHSSHGSGGTGKKIALVIGNNHYKKITPLDNPAHDATDIAAALKDLGFEVTLQTDIKRTDFILNLKAFGQQAQKANVALFYFSGHGLQVDGENILTPTDYTLDNPEKGVSANTVQKVMQDATNGTKLLILDACRNDPFISKAGESSRGLKKRGLIKGRSLSKGLAPMIPLKEFIIMYSTAAGETASDGTNRNSPYTAALLRHINEPIPIETLFKRVTLTVQQTTQPPQLPANYTAGLTGDFCFTGCGVDMPEMLATCRIKIGKGLYEGECQDGKANGQGVQRYADGEYYTGSFQNNLRQGYGKQYLTDGTEISGYWERGRLSKKRP